MLCQADPAYNKYFLGLQLIGPCTYICIHALFFSEVHFIFILLHIYIQSIFVMYIFRKLFVVGNKKIISLLLHKNFIEFRVYNLFLHLTFGMFAFC